MDKITSPRLDWVQVEVTTHCNALCVYCPHTVLQNRWTDRHMPIELFHELVPFLGHTDLVYLQGWGEPLLNKDIFEMVRICKDQGKRVGFTTNGVLLSENTIRILVDLQLDIIGISLAGTTATTHNQIRKGTDFNKVISHLKLLREIKAERKTEVPAIHLAYLMLKTNFHEIKEILPIGRRVDAKEIIASNLTLLMDPELSSEAIFNDTNHTDHYRRTLEEMTDRAAKENIIFDYHGPGLDDASVRCRENVRHACVINVEGEVVPCVLANPVLPSYYIFKNQSIPLRGILFGNIRNENLTRIWNKKEYATFRDLFDPQIRRKGEEIRSEMPQCCKRCYKRLEESPRTHEASSEATPVSDMVRALC